jgi:hypothetical protein
MLIWVIREWRMVMFLVPNYINIRAMAALSLQAVIPERERG